MHIVIYHPASLISPSLWCSSLSIILIYFIACSKCIYSVDRCPNLFSYLIIASTAHMPSSVLWLSGTYAVTLGPILWVICFAASLPPNSTAPIRLAQSQPRNTELSDRDLSTRDYATTAQFYNDLSARAAVSPQSSSTVVAPKTTDSDYFAPSSSPSHKPSLEYVSSNVTILPKSTVEALNATDGPSFTSPTSATLSALSFSTAVGLLHDNAITPALLDVTSDVSSILSQTNSIGLTSSPVSILGTGAQAYRITTIATSLNHSSSTSASSSLTNTIPTLAPTSTSPTNVAALTDGIALGGALLLFSKNAAEVGPNIVKPATKTASLKSLATIQSKLERAFKDLKGVDTGGPCIAKTKRFKPRKRDILSDLQNDFRCAIDSVNSLQIHLNVEDPDPTVVADDLAVVGKWAQELETDEERKDDDDDDETSTTSTTTIKSTKTTTSNLTPQRTMTTSRTSSSVSRKSASRTATVSSGHSFNATCYTGPEYLFPASAAASAAAGSQSVVFKMLDFALSSFFAMDPPVPFPTTIPNSTWVMENSVTISQSELNSGIAQTSQVFPIVSRTTKSPNTIALPSCMGDGSPNFRPTVSQVQIKRLPRLIPREKSWCICATSLTYPALQTSGAGIRATANCAYTSLPSSTIDPTSVPNTMATPVPGQNGISQCVYEM